MAIPFRWFFVLHYQDQKGEEHINYGITTCEKANTAYNRAKKWCTENNHIMVYFDANVSPQHYREKPELYTLEF